MSENAQTKNLDDMTTDELTFYHSEIKLQIKGYLFRRLSENEKSELRTLKRTLKRVQSKINHRQFRLDGF